MLKTLLLIFVISIFANANCLANDYADELVREAKTENLYKDLQWIKLLHYQKRLFGGYKSDADALNFFMAGVSGRTSPEEELYATIRSFFNTEVKEIDSSSAQQHPQCQFPARYRWLKSKLHFDSKKLKEFPCERFKKFFNGLAAKSVTVVFSSYFLNNPSSAFGHTMMRMNKEANLKDGKRYELLDYGISYAATVTVNNPILYAFYGIFGLFPGSLTSLPYYYKVREYNDFESRDLWEYELSLSQEEVDRLVEHIWELGSTVFYYYYLDENCSYFILTMLEAAKPSLQLIEKLPSLVTPADTIRALGENESLIRTVHYRPAMRVQFRERLKLLSPKQEDALADVLSKRDEQALQDLKAQNLTPTEQAQVLDAAMDYIDFRYSKDVLLKQSAILGWKQKLLIARADIPVQSKDVPIEMPVKEMPHTGHKAARFGLNYGLNNSLKNFYEADYRMALHDLADESQGFPEFSQIEFLNTKLRYYTDSKELHLDNFSFVRILSLSPWSRFQKDFSWKVNVGASEIHGRSCTGCHKGVIAFGGGATILPFRTESIALVPMGELEASASKGYEPTFFRLQAGPSLLLRISFNKNLKWLTEAKRVVIWPSEIKFASQLISEMRFSFHKNWAVQARTRIFDDQKEWSAGAIRYF